MKTSDFRPTVVLADDHAGILDCVMRLLSPNHEILATVDNGRKAVEAVEHYKPDVVVLDIGMPVLDGLGAARELTLSQTKTKIILLTVWADESYIKAAFENGASGFVLKSCMQSDLANAIQYAMDGRVFVSGGRKEAAIQTTSEPVKATI
jgi:DNA-binding NarL/FixJ family response regulator